MMNLHYAVPARASLRMALLAGACLLLQGCTTSPTSGRAQFNILPGSLETTVPDLRFEVKTMIATAGGACGEEPSSCPIRAEAEQLTQRIAPIADHLGAKAVELSPELAARVPVIEVFVVPSESASVNSSAGGKIAIDAGLARLGLSDTDLALALGREFGRLAAAHHRESTSAGLAVSLVASSPLVGAYVATSLLADLLFPMGALVKVGISLLGSMGTEQLVELSQQDEADAFAAKLMAAAGYDLGELAQARPALEGSSAQFGWLSGYAKSRGKVAALAPQSVMLARTGGVAPFAPAANPDEMAPPKEAVAPVPASPDAADAAAEVRQVASATRAAPAPLDGMTAETAASPPPPPPSDTLAAAQAPAVETPAGSMDQSSAESQKPSAAAIARAEEVAAEPERPDAAIAGKKPAARAKAGAVKSRPRSAKAPTAQAAPTKARPATSKAVAKPKTGPKAAAKAPAKPPHKLVRKPPSKPSPSLSD